MASRQESQEELERRRSRLRQLPNNILATFDGEAVAILDVSLTGLGFETTRSPDPDAQHELELYTEVGELTLKGTVAWCREAGTTEKDGRRVPLRRVGIRFSPLPRKDAIILQQLLEHQARKGGNPEDPREEFTTEFSEMEVAEQLRLKRSTSKRR